MLEEKKEETFSKNDKKKKSKKHFNFKTVLIVILFSICVLEAVFINFAFSEEEYTENKYETLIQANDELRARVSELENKVHEAKPWFEKTKAEKEKLIQEQDQKKQEEERKKREQEQAEARRLEEEEKKGYNTGITYQQLAREPKKYEYKKVKFRGKIIQVVEGDDNYNNYRMAVNGNYDNIILLNVSKKLVEEKRILENDIITAMGTSAGVISYKSTIGGNITIPGMQVEKIET